MYVEHLVEVFAEVARVLRSDGTLWVNLGETYWGGKGQSNFGMVREATDRTGTLQKHHHNLTGGRGMTRPQDMAHPLLKPKDLVGIPWRVAFALQEGGWYLRNDIIWSKPNPMPESVKDRCTRAHEYVFMFAHPDSGGRYFYDHDAIREPSSESTKLRWGDRISRVGEPGTAPERNDSGGTGEKMCGVHPGGRNKRTVWTVPTKPYPGAHFAVWPPELVEPMVLAGTSEKGACADCGAPWRRVVEKPERPAGRDNVEVNPRDGGLHAEHGMERTGMSHFQYNQWLKANPPQMMGWEPTCDCGAGMARCVVLDPFSGSGTTGMVALAADRDYIGIDLNAEYLDLAEARVLGEAAPEEPEPDEPGSVFDLFGV